MTVTGEYVPSASQWVRDQVETILQSGTTESVDIMGRPVILMSMLGAESGKLRRVPVMRVEHDGEYVAVASKAGAPDNPQWYANLLANPRITVQDGTAEWDAVARELTGTERDEWWQRCVEAFPNYAEYQEGTERVIPIFLLESQPDE
ncbi:MAG: nitroreductase family deazaflavin-dependent oxidoreductase [Euzebya sp.]